MGGNLLTFKVNTYLSLLIITVVGAGATLLIIRVANADPAAVLHVSPTNAALRAALQKAP
jgi:hypothetical protein